MANIEIYKNPDQLARAAADLFKQKAAAANGRFTVALAGGSTPIPFYKLLATDAYAAQIDWNGVHVFFGDERVVPQNHEDSNYAAIQSAFLSQVPIPLENVHRIKGELDAEAAAKDYGERLQRFFDGGPPAFDLNIIGMGTDGHTLSLFPGKSEALHERKHRVVATSHPNHKHPRVTLTAWAANTSEHIVSLVRGAEKAAVLKAVLEGSHQPQKYPIQLIQPTSGQLTWMLDQSVAAQLRNTSP